MKKNYIIAGSIIICFLVGILVFNLRGSFAEVLESGSKVEPETNLTYYVNVNYNGRDSDLVASSSSVRARVYSDIINVEDKLPNGLTFLGFESTNNGTIGAYQGNVSCSGYVIDDTKETSSDTCATDPETNNQYCSTCVGNDCYYHGLHYNTETEVVSFQVKSLQAGCTLTAGIVTKLPALGSDLRKDFYNTALGRENDYGVNSNTVHVYMGKSNATLYNVTYVYDNSVEVPATAPALPGAMQYSEDAVVGVEKDLVLGGYEFSGWTTTDVTVNNGVFAMPTTDVTFVGSFTKKSQYNVSYVINGDAPESFRVPKQKTYSAGEDVKVDSLSVGDEIDGYMFLGWDTSSLPNVSASNGTDSTLFVMPSNDVTITGSFELIKYNITYAFQGSVMPPNADNLIPEEESYAPGTIVSLAAYPQANGYEFLGWYHIDNFKMPYEDIVIYGEWMEVAGKFVPTISKSIIDEQDVYKEGDKVKFKITVTNTANYKIEDVLLEELLTGAKFTEGEGYEIKTSSSQIVLIPEILSKKSIDVYAEYTVDDDSARVITNTVELVGAVADNNYILDTSKDYKATIDFQTNMNGTNDGTIEEESESNNNNNNNNGNTEEPITNNDNNEQENNGSKEIVNPTPKTLDDIYYYFFGFGILAIIIVVIVVYIKRTKKNGNGTSTKEE